jgi:hypothetical protein
MANAIGGEDGHIGRNDHFNGRVSPNNKTVGNDNAKENKNEKVPRKADVHEREVRAVSW